MDFHLAQLNVARLLAPLESEQLAGFVAQLEPINALADAAPGFVWRLQTEAGDATSVQAFEDPWMLVNMSVWESLEALRAYVYGGAHAEVMRGRRQWFAKAMRPYMVLWWVPAGHRPNPAEAIGRLDLLGANGPTPDAFTFRTRFPADGTATATEGDADAPGTS